MARRSTAETSSAPATLDPPPLSGRYVSNGGAHPVRPKRLGLSAAELSNPLYDLDGPVYLQGGGRNGRLACSSRVPAFTLHVDIDGPAPLGVVSGTVGTAILSPASGAAHFIGMVTRSHMRNGQRHLLVENFTFNWPGNAHVIDRLEIQLRRSKAGDSHARVTFIATMAPQRFGPFTAARESTYFREAEVEVDVEEDAVNPEPYASNLHPDRPADLQPAVLTLESAFARAGIGISRVEEPGRAVPTREAGRDERWSEAELHDSMVRHWQAFANRPQWKLWIFLANRAEDDGLGGVMFDGEIDEPGGVDRQGTAIFTKCPVFHTPEGDYCAANPPSDLAVRRELFFNLIHETGHAFNLAHAFGKSTGAWEAPPWAPVAGGEQALSWMNYPDLATASPDGRMNASWFYRRFRFMFDPGELLFLRHAPAHAVEMGAASWFENHGRASRASADARLALTIRTRKEIFEFGEPVMLELKLKNTSDSQVLVHRHLDPTDGLVEIAVTNPRGERRPMMPFAHTRRRMEVKALAPGEAVYRAVDATMGKLGFHFKEPGAYRIEATCTTLQGRTASGVMRCFVRPPRSFDDLPRIARIFDAAVGRVLYVEGTRVMEDVNELMDGVAESLGPQHPLSLHLRTIRYLPYARDWKVVNPADDNVSTIGAEPDVCAAQLAPVVLDRTAESADTMGHIWFNEVVDTFTRAALESGAARRAAQAQQQMIELFRRRSVKDTVIACAEARLREIG